MHFLRQLVVGDPAPAHGDHVFFGERVVGAGGEHHRDFAPAVVGLADHGGVGDSRIREDVAFDLGGVDVLSARLDHVFDPVEEI